MISRVHMPPKLPIWSFAIVWLFIDRYQPPHIIQLVIFSWFGVWSVIQLIAYFVGKPCEPIWKNEV